MSERDQAQTAPAEDQPEAPTGGGDPKVPIEEWIPHQVSDSSDYLDASPVYPEDLSGDDKVAFEASLAEREKRLAGHKPREKKPRR